MRILFFLLTLGLSPIALSHGGAEGAGAQIGANKGVTEKGPEGFKLSPEATKTIGYQTASIGSNLQLPKEAIVRVKDDKSFYRIRDGWIKRISLDHKDLKSGDQVIVSQLGFLRIVEVYVSGDEADEHTEGEGDKHND